MAPEKAPAFQFYPKDFLSDGHVAGMSLAERGAYITLLCLCWREESLSANTKRLSRIVGTSHRAFLQVWPAVRECFVERDGRLTHKRLDMERVKQAKYRERQSQAGRASVAARFNHGSTTVQPRGNQNSTLLSPISDLSLVKEQPEREREQKTSLSPAALSDLTRDAFTDQSITERAGRFLDRYDELYQRHRHGARYARKPVRDYAAAVTLCQTWLDDDRLDKLAVIFLTTDHRFAEEGSRTVPQFLALASWADGKLAEYEAKRASA